MILNRLSGDPFCHCVHCSCQLVLACFVTATMQKITKNPTQFTECWCAYAENMNFVLTLHVNETKNVPIHGQWNRSGRPGSCLNSKILYCFFIYL